MMTPRELTPVCSGASHFIFSFLSPYFLLMTRIQMFYLYKSVLQIRLLEDFFIRFGILKRFHSKGY